MLSTNSIEERLLNLGIKRTLFRVELFRLFLESKKSLSHQDIKEKIKSTQDKVTIYRALETFLKKGIIHRVPDYNNVAKYALSTAEEVVTHKHNHVHFICVSCKETYCLEEIEVPIVNQPKGFKIFKSSFTLEGECPKCSYEKEQ